MPKRLNLHDENPRSRKTNVMRRSGSLLIEGILPKDVNFKHFPGVNIFHVHRHPRSIEKKLNVIDEESENMWNLLTTHEKPHFHTKRQHNFTIGRLN
jgi:hypothetical protein